MDWEKWEAELTPRDECERRRRRLLEEAFTKYEFMRFERPAFCKEYAVEMKSADGKWCRTCKTLATTAEGDGSAQHDGDESIAEFGEAAETKKIRALSCAKCKDVKGKKNLRADSADWKNTYPNVPLSSTTCLSSLTTRRTCRKRKRDLPRPGKGCVGHAPRCAPGCGAYFWGTRHLPQTQKKDRRRERNVGVARGDCSKRGVTAKGVADGSKRLKRRLTCAAREKGFPRQDRVSDAHESDHFARKSQVVRADCIADGFTSRNWHPFQFFGACRKKLPKSRFADGQNFARFHERRALTCKASA